MLEVGGFHFRVVGPNGAKGKAGGELEGEGLAEMGEAALEEPGGLGEVGMDALLVFIGDYAAWVTSRSPGDLGFDVFVEVSLAGVADFKDLVILERELVAAGSDAPDMEATELRVVVERNEHDAGVSALRAEDLDDVAAVLRGSAIGRDAVGGVVQKDDGIGLERIDGKGLSSRGANPIGDAVWPGGEGRSRAQGDKSCKSKACARPTNNAEARSLMILPARR